MSDKEQAKNKDISDEIFALLRGDSEDGESKKKNRRSNDSDSELSRSSSDLSDNSIPSPVPRHRSKVNQKAVSNMSGSSSGSSTKSTGQRKKLSYLTEIEREQIIAEKAERRQKKYEKKELENRINKQHDKGRKDIDESDEEWREGSDREYMANSRPARAKQSKQSKALKAIKERRNQKTSKRDEYRSSDEDYSDVSGGGRSGKHRRDDDRHASIIPEDTDTSPEVENIEEFHYAVLDRTFLGCYVHYPWFNSHCKGMYVSVAMPESKDAYRIGLITDVVDGEDSYFIEGYETWTYKLLELKHGNEKKLFNFNNVSNQSPSQTEMMRLKESFKAISYPWITQDRLKFLYNRKKVAVSRPETEEESLAKLASNWHSSKSLDVLGYYRADVNRRLRGAIASKNKEKEDEIREELFKLEERIQSLLPPRQPTPPPAPVQTYVEENPFAAWYRNQAEIKEALEKRLREQPKVYISDEEGGVNKCLMKERPVYNKGLLPFKSIYLAKVGPRTEKRSRQDTCWETKAKSYKFAKLQVKSKGEDSVKTKVEESSKNNIEASINGANMKNDDIAVKETSKDEAKIEETNKNNSEITSEELDKINNENYTGVNLEVNGKN